MSPRIHFVINLIDTFNFVDGTDSGDVIESLPQYRQEYNHITSLRPRHSMYFAFFARTIFSWTPNTAAICDVYKTGTSVASARIEIPVAYMHAERRRGVNFVNTELAICVAQTCFRSGDQKFYVYHFVARKQIVLVNLINDRQALEVIWFAADRKRLKIRVCSLLSFLQCQFCLC